MQLGRNVQFLGRSTHLLRCGAGKESVRGTHGTGAHKNAAELRKVGLEAENTELQALVKEWRMWYAQCALVAEAAPSSVPRVAV